MRAWWASRRGVGRRRMLGGGFCAGGRRYRLFVGVGTLCGIVLFGGRDKSGTGHVWEGPSRRQSVVVRG